MKRGQQSAGNSRSRDAQKKKSPADSRAQRKTSEKSSAFRHCARRRTRSPRYMRLLRALLLRPVTRERADSIAGASNSPGLVLKMRRDGLMIHCDKREVIDRDGRTVRPGTYRLDPRSRRKAEAMLRGA